MKDRAASAPDGVGLTAVGAALMRAIEGSRPDRLFNDPFAQLFVDSVPGVFDDAPVDPELADSLFERFLSHVVIRTRFFDDFLLGAARRRCRQIVLLACGLDTRGFRLSWPSDLVVYELDLPEIQGFKEEVLDRSGARPKCDRRAVPVDLRDDWQHPLIAAGCDQSTPTAWLAEGLFVYLSAEEAVRTLHRIHSLSAPGSRIAFDASSVRGSSLFKTASGAPDLEAFTSLWKGGFEEKGSHWLDGHGWRTRRHAVADLASTYGRSVPPDLDDGIVTADRVRTT